MNSDNIEKRLNFSMSELELFPKYIHIETINACNARCVMCGIDFDSKSLTYISNENYNKLLTELELWNHHIEKVMLYLDSEPLLDQSIYSKIQSLKKIGIKKVNIASNASLLSDQNIKKLIASGLDEIYITIDGATEETYERIRKGLSFRKVVDNTNKLINIRNEVNSPLKIRVQIIEQALNEGEIKDFTKYWKPRINPRQDEVVIQKEHNWGNKHNPSYPTERYSTACIALWGTLNIHANGKVPLCCLDTETEHKLGDIGESSLQEIWQHPIFNKYRELHLQNERQRIELCRDCNLWREDKRAIVTD